MGSHQRNKGKRGELEAVKLLKAVFPNAARKVVNHAGQENGVDLINTGNLRVQVKRGKRVAPISKINEVQSADGIPLLLTRGDGGEWFAVMKGVDLVKMLGDIGEAYY